MRSGKSWFPGHMATAHRKWQENLAGAHLVLMVLDARIPASSMPLLLREGKQQKPVFLLLNKADLAEEKVTRAWIAHFRQQGWWTAAVDARQRHQVERLQSRWRQVVSKTTGKPGRRIRVLVGGLPNTGKSTVINQMAGKRKAGTGAQPGVTRGQQWIQVNPDLQVLDTPGVLVPTRTSAHSAWRLLACGIMPREAGDVTEAACSLWQYICEQGRSVQLAERLGLELEPVDCESLLSALARRRGFLTAGGELEREKAAAHLLLGFQEGGWGAWSLELPGEDDELE